MKGDGKRVGAGSSLGPARLPNSSMSVDGAPELVHGEVQRQLSQEPISRDSKASLEGRIHQLPPGSAPSMNSASLAFEPKGGGLRSDGSLSGERFFHSRMASERGDSRLPQPARIRETPGIEEGTLIAGRYCLERRLGVGQLGQVFLARDVMELGDLYALKVLHPWLAQEERAVELFTYEFLRMKRLDHPGVVRSYVMERDPALRVWFSLMEYVEGPSLKQVIEGALLEEGRVQPFRIEEILMLFARLAPVFRYLQAKRIVHRDLKPSHILWTKPEGGDIKLIGFGMAASLVGPYGSSIELGRGGASFYTAPERITEGQTISVATDVFSLGVILYQMLTGSLPIGMAAMPSQLSPSLPAEIDGVLRRALDPRWENRYPSVDDMIGALKRALLPDTREGGRHKPAPTLRSAKRLMRTRTSAPLIHSVQDVLPARQRQQPPSLHASSMPASGMETAAASPLAPAPSALIEEGSLHWQRELDAVDDATLETLTIAAQREQEERQKLEENPHFHLRPPRPKSLSHQRAKITHPSPIVRRKRQPSSAHKETAMLRAVSKPEASPLEEPAQALHAPQKSGPITNAERLSRLRRRFAARSIEEPSTSKSAAPLSHPHPPRTLSFQTHQRDITALAFDPEGCFLASASSDGTIKLWEVPSWYLLHTIKLDMGQALHLAWAPQGKWLAYSDNCGNVLIRDVMHPEKCHTFSLGAPCTSISWSADGQLLCVGDIEGKAYIWELSSIYIPAWVTLHERGIHALAAPFGRGFGPFRVPPERLLLSGGADGALRMWDLHQPEKPLLSFSERGSSICTVSFHPKEPLLLSGNTKGELQYWEPQFEGQTHSWNGHDGPISHLMMSHHGVWFVSGSDDNTFKLWRTSDAELLTTFSTHKAPVFGASLSPDSQWLALCDQLDLVLLWDVSIWNP